MTTLYVGLDVHKAMIAVAEEGRRGKVRSCGTIDNNPLHIDKLIRRLSKGGQELQFCYEAGCCGYPLQRQIAISFDTSVRKLPEHKTVSNGLNCQQLDRWHFRFVSTSASGP